jgi:hypothetical protein
VTANGDDGAGTLIPQGHALPTRQATVDLAAAGGPARESGRALRLLGLIAVAVGIAALTAAACTLSYSSIHHLAIDAGVTRRLAAIYPFIFDALIVIAGCSVLALRGAGLPSKIYAWFCLLVLLGALAAGGAARAAAIHIPHREAAIVAAVIPWALVLIGFGLLLALLRYARIRRQGRRPRPADGPTSGARRDADNAAPPEIVVMANTAEPPGRPALAGGTESGGQPASGKPGPAAEPRLPVRQAEMRLRARIPRQPTEQAQPEQLHDESAQPAQPPSEQEQAGQVHPPFMPPVGLQPTGKPTNPRPAHDPPAPAPPEPEPAAAASGQESGPDDESTLSPAPVDDEPTEPPVLRRPHSSPTPPGE